MSMDDSLRASSRLANSQLQCKNSCGFYGNPMWDGYCSKCYKEVKNHSPLTRRQFDSYSDSIAPQGSPQLSTAMALGSVAPESPVSAPFSTSGGQSLEPKGAGSPLSNSIEQSPAASPTLRAKLASSVSKVSPNTQAKSSLREKLSSPRLGRKGSLVTSASASKPTAAASTAAANLTESSSSGGQSTLAFGKFEEKKRAQNSTKKGLRIFKAKSLKDAPDATAGSSEVPNVNDERQKAASDLTDLLKTLKKGVNQDVTQQLKRFVRRMLHEVQSLNPDDQASVVQEWYQWFEDRMQTNTIFRSVTQDQAKLIMDYIEKFLMASIYTVVWSARGGEDEEKDKKLSQRLRCLQWVSPSHLEIESVASSTKAMTWLQRAQQELLMMDGRRSPSEKLRHVTQCCTHIFNALTHASGGAPASADDFLPVLIYVVLQAAPARLNSNIQYISRFSNQNNLLSGESGYHFTNLCCSVSFLENANAETLHVPQDEFDGWMASQPSGPSPHGQTTGADEVDALVRQESPAVESLHQCVQKLILLSRQQDKQMEDCQQLKKEFALFRANLVCKVEEALKPVQARKKVSIATASYTTADV